MIMVTLERGPRRINYERTEANKGQERSDPPRILSHRLTKRTACYGNKIRSHQALRCLPSSKCRKNARLVAEAANVLPGSIYYRKLVMFYAKWTGKSSNRFSGIRMVFSLRSGRNNDSYACSRSLLFLLFGFSSSYSVVGIKSDHGIRGTGTEQEERNKIFVMFQVSTEPNLSRKKAASALLP